MDSAGRQALAWSHGNYGYGAHCHCGTADGKTADWMEKVSDEQYRR